MCFENLFSLIIYCKAEHRSFPVVVLHHDPCYFCSPEMTAVPLHSLVIGCRQKPQFSMSWDGKQGACVCACM